MMRARLRGGVLAKAKRGELKVRTNGERIGHGSPRPKGRTAVTQH